MKKNIIVWVFIIMGVCAVLNTSGETELESEAAQLSTEVVPEEQLQAGISNLETTEEHLKNEISKLENQLNAATTTEEQLRTEIARLKEQL